MNKNSGFTLIEMLIVLGVTILLSGLLIIYSRESEDFSLILRTRTQVISDINRAKNLAINSQTVENNQPTCGYGIYFNTSNNSYIIFADLSSNCEKSTHIRNSADTKDIETIPLPSKIVLSKSDIQQVFFLPPDPTVYFEPPISDNGTNPQAKITFNKASDNEIAFQIFINPIGRVWGQ